MSQVAKIVNQIVISKYDERIKTETAIKRWGIPKHKTLDWKYTEVTNKYKHWLTNYVHSYTNFVLIVHISWILDVNSFNAQ